ncbi:LysE family translocator [Acuticoccus kandeliae]|uniref:LysE family translocator n=1 Tax=Acuticoccus kandeliae TaxID=2073160 RepID=UPI000D3EBAF3|nr:LysE family transporter [Acuticoccus kandeliae]
MFLLTVALIWLVAAITPGPNFLVVVRCALTGSRPVAYAAVGGTLFGTFLWGLAGWLGITALFAAAPYAYAALKLVGGIYIAYLGVRILWRLRRAGDAALPDRALDLTPRAAFRLALFTNLANPKSAVFVASLFAAALPQDHPWWAGPVAVAMMVSISALWYAILSTSLSHRSVANAYLGVRRAVDAATGMVFVAFGTALAAASR